MPAITASILAISLAAGIYLGSAALPDTSNSIAPWWQTGEIQTIVSLSGIVTEIEDNTFTLEQLGTPPMRIQYDEETVVVARPQRTVAGRVDGIRLLVIPPNELLHPGLLAKVVIRMNKENQPPYAFTVIGIPL